ncbi:glycosyltransferase [Shouchella shacheensis]|uniref:glycosyltransferase n=1 Tax=Shouchella shacheensis TaxID=1649580 RepID=UPI000740090F|nr:glycosyltransferase [Shouchella shacheensis]
MIELYSFALLAILGFVLVNGWFMPRLKGGAVPPVEPAPLVSILVPLRDEERNVGLLIESLKELTYPKMEFIFLDDGSQDQTLDLLRTETKHLEHSRVIKGAPLPEGWVGKVHACYQLGMEAKGAYLLFLDADIRLRSHTVEKTVRLSQKKNAGLISGFPRFPVHSLLGRLLVPLQHVIIYVHLPLFIANHTMMSRASAAHGSFMFFSRCAYENVQGHRAVASSLVEDVHITRAVKEAGGRAILANITNVASCYMYESNREVWNGFLKNIFAGIGRSYLVASCIILFYSFFFILPLPLAVWGVLSGSYQLGIPLLITWMMRLLVDLRTKQNPFLCLLMPFSSMVLVVILVTSIHRTRVGDGFEWKGRRYK